MEKRASWGLHSFLEYLALVVDLFPVLEQICFLGVDQDGTVHMLH